MAILPKEEREFPTKQIIDLTSSEGNAFYLLATAKGVYNQFPEGHFDKSFDEIKEEMKADDYEHLIQTFDKYFGDYIDLQR